MHRVVIIRFASAIAAVALLASCGAQPAAEAVDTGKIAEVVKANTAEVIAAFNAHDAEKAVSYDAPDYVGMFHGIPNVVGPEADLALTKQQVVAAT